MLTTRMQIQSLADRLAGLPVGEGLKPTLFSEPWKTCWLALDAAPPSQIQAALVQALRDLPDRDSIIGAIFAACPGASLGSFPSLQELAQNLRPVEWVWPGWIPRGMITLLGAVPGSGKSFLALDLAHRIIHGDPFPDGAATPHPGANVIYVDAEAVPQLLNERANFWQMDTSRIYLMLPDSDTGESTMIDFSLPFHRDRLVEMTAELHPELVIVDSLSSISSKGENNVEDVRQVLSFLNLLAQDFQVGLLLIHHLRKVSSAQSRLWDLSIDDFRGSGHIIAIARSVMGLYVVQTDPDPDRNGPRKLEIIKTNLGPYPDPLGFAFVPLHPTGVMLKWGSPPEPYCESTRLDDCKAWLELQLHDGDKRPAELVELGEAEGFSRSLIYRARDELGPSIENTFGRQHPKNVWKWLDQ